MRLYSAQKSNTIRGIVLSFSTFLLVLCLLLLPVQKTNAAQITNLGISGAGISNYSANVSTSITPTITFQLPGGLLASDNLTLNFNGVVTDSAILSSDIVFGGSCSGSPTLVNSVGLGVLNPTFIVTNITCGTLASTISFAASKLSTQSTATKANILILTPLDFGQFIFFVGGGNQVNITASVLFTVNIKVYPEKRVPATGNWVNQNTIQIRTVGSTTPIISQVVSMNVNGDGTMSPIDPIILPAGTYDFAIKGYSHLRKIYTGTISTAVTNLDFTGPGNEMLAGDTSLVEDNYINSLDLSNLSRNLYTGDIKNDLNRDTSVNSLDLSNIAFNLYKSGQN